MCLIFFSWKKHPTYKLVVAANRDEFYKRPTRNMHWWDEHSELLAGKDLEAGGSWMGVSKNGKFAAITNYRQFPIEKTFATSRGDLVKNFLVDDEITPKQYLDFLKSNGDQYDGFNLIFGSLNDLYYFSNRSERTKELAPGVYGLSNHLLDTSWPKVDDGKQRFKVALDKDEKEDYFELLANSTTYSDSVLPNTGIGLEKERMLSSAFIQSPDYGTRTSTLLKIDRKNNISIEERSFVPDSHITTFNFHSNS